MGILLQLGMGSMKETNYLRVLSNRLVVLSPIVSPPKSNVAQNLLGMLSEQIHDTIHIANPVVYIRYKRRY